MLQITCLSVHDTQARIPEVMHQNLHAEKGLKSGTIRETNNDVQFEPPIAVHVFRDTHVPQQVSQHRFYLGLHNCQMECSRGFDRVRSFLPLQLLAEPVAKLSDTAYIHLQVDAAAVSVWVLMRVVRSQVWWRWAVRWDVTLRCELVVSNECCLMIVIYCGLLPMTSQTGQ